MCVRACACACKSRKSRESQDYFCSLAPSVLLLSRRPPCWSFLPLSRTFHAAQSRPLFRTVSCSPPLSSKCVFPDCSTDGYWRCPLPTGKPSISVLQAFLLSTASLTSWVVTKFILKKLIWSLPLANFLLLEATWTSSLCLQDYPRVFLKENRVGR